MENFCVASLVLAAGLFLSAIPTGAEHSIRELKITRQNANLLENLGDYPDLEVLSIECLEKLQALPESIGSLSKLKELNIDNGNGCSMNPILPESIGNLRCLEKLILYGAQDSKVFVKFGRPQPGEHHKFPESMSQVKNLVYLDLGRNGFQEMPSFIQDLPKLKELRFQWNRGFRQLPTFLANLHELETLRLDGDSLNDLPNFLNSLPKLAHVTLGDNCDITANEAKVKNLERRFPKIDFDFRDEYDCPEVTTK